MAELKQYGYYIKGSKVAIVERDTTFDNDLNSKDFGPGSDRAQWKSPLSNIADGLEIQYCYSPQYTIDQNVKNTDLTQYTDSSSCTEIDDVYLQLHDSDITGLGYYNFNNILSEGDYFVLRKAGRFNGLHRVQMITNASGGGTGNVIITYSRGYNLSDTLSDFEESPELYFNVNVLEDEYDTIDLPEYLCKALVDYVKAKMFEDARDLEGKEYFMKEFRKKIEKYNNSRVSTMRLVVPGGHAIR